MPPPTDGPYLLLVEGTDDLHSVIALLRNSGYDWDDESRLRPNIKPQGGFAEVLDAFPLAVKGRYQRIGAILDADLDLDARWAGLLTRASEVGVHLPPNPDPAGTVVSGPRADSRIGIWLMPDNRLPGTLEDFLGRLIPSEDSCWPYASDATVEARRRGAPCRPSDHMKSALHTWLAWRERPGVPFGTALTAKFFETGGEHGHQLVAWFHRLFSDPECAAGRRLQPGRVAAWK